MKNRGGIKGEQLYWYTQQENRINKISKCWFLKKTRNSKKRKENATKRIRKEKEDITADIEKNIFNFKIIYVQI